MKTVSHEPRFKTKTLQGLFWIFLECGDRQGTQFVISIVPAHPPAQVESRMSRTALTTAKRVAERILCPRTYNTIAEEIAERICLVVSRIRAFCGLET